MVFMVMPNVLLAVRLWIHAVESCRKLVLSGFLSVVKLSVLKREISHVLGFLEGNSVDSLREIRRSVSANIGIIPGKLISSEIGWCISTMLWGEISLLLTSGLSVEIGHSSSASSLLCRLGMPVGYSAVAWLWASSRSVSYAHASVANRSPVCGA